ncbi:hypothetical protein AMJ80_05770 [bacterium SM23_31]|nr:MAG: hypothetical protein AMJ80_05770 [bacterium SM23_31]
MNSLLFAAESDTKGEKRTPAVYIPTIYFAEGLPYVLVNIVSVAFYTKLGIPDSLIGLYTSLLMWPWIIKMFWGPVVDKYYTKRTWLLFMQITCAALFVFIAAGLNADSFFYSTLILFGIIAFVSATHDISIDGFYMLSITQKQQAFFVGIRNLFYRFAMIFGTGALYNIVGKIEANYGIEYSWISAFLICAVLFAVLTMFHCWYLPYPAADIQRNTFSTPSDDDKESYAGFIKYYVSVFKQFFLQKKIIPILAFILLFRFGEALLVKMSQPFLIRSMEEGGLGLSIGVVGDIYGFIGLISLMIGGILGGWAIAKFGLRKCIWPMALALNLPNLLYVYLAYVKPPLTQVAAAIAIEQFGYGVGFSAFMMFLIHISKGENKTSLYAIATGVMALGLMIPGMISGFIREWLGYQNFFIFATLLTIPGMITIFFIPLEDDKH